MYSTVRVMEHGGRLATLSECPNHLSSCDDKDDGDAVDDYNDDVYFGDGNDEGDDFEEKKKDRW